MVVIKSQKGESTIARINERRIDGASAVSVKDELLKIVGERPGRLIVDFSKVEIISSYGLGAMIEVQKQLGAQGGELRLSALSQMILDTFRTSKLDTVLDIYESIDDAL